MDIKIPKLKYSLLLLGFLAGCQSTPPYYQGVSENAFPRHNLNFLFNEALVLDYTDLQAKSWYAASQETSGSYAKTVLLPKRESDNHWTRQITVAFYPDTTNSFAKNLLDGARFLENQLHHYCHRGAVKWDILSRTDSDYWAQVSTKGCEKTPDGYALYRLKKTSSGVHEIQWIQKTPFTSEELLELRDSLSKARVIVRQDDYQVSAFFP